MCKLVTVKKVQENCGDTAVRIYVTQVILLDRTKYKFAKNNNNNNNNKKKKNRKKVN